MQRKKDQNWVQLHGKHNLMSLKDHSSSLLSQPTAAEPSVYILYALNTGCLSFTVGYYLGKGEERCRVESCRLII